MGIIRITRSLFLVPIHIQIRHLTFRRRRGGYSKNDLYLLHMGQGLQKVAKMCGGLTVAARGKGVKYSAAGKILRSWDVPKRVGEQAGA